MDMKITQLVANLAKQPAASEVEIRHLQRALGLELPDQYRSFLRMANGAEGWIGENQNSYLIMHSVEGVIDLRRAYLDAGAPEWLVLFGSSGGGSGYGFDARVEAMPIVETDWFFELLYVRGSTFLEFLEYLAAQDSNR